ncbi:MAG: hypothetical protein V7607_1215 [Solirubrobacteraceae bacterium]
MKTHITATRHGGTHARIKQALAEALGPELDLDAGPAARDAFVRGNFEADLAGYSIEVDKILEEIASVAVARLTPIRQERDRIHQEAATFAQEQIDRLPRRDHLIYGPVGIE